MKPISTRISHTLFAILLVLGCMPTQAAPGTLPDSPLFIDTAVQPNIFFMIDDSGSMAWADLLNAGTFSPGSALLTDFTWYMSSVGLYSSWWNYTLRRQSCRGFNVMAYDPTQTYSAWQGKDSAGTEFSAIDMSDLTNIRYNPYDPSTTTDISGHYYWVWTDTDGDGEYDGPGSTDAGGAPSGTDECGDVSSNSGGVAVSSLSAAEKLNYANWYSYYRTREYTAKKALSEVIKQSTARMGLEAINSHYTATEIKDVDDLTTPVDATAQANKNSLLTNLVSGYSSGGTPLRRGLETAGKYYKGSHASWSSPILSAANGGECQQNFTLLMSDGYWNGSDPTTVGIADNDSDDDTSYDGGSHADGDTASTIDDTLADIAMYYYEYDLDGTLADLVPTKTGVDENPMQHMVTYTVAFGVNGTLSTDPSDRTSAFAWPTPVADTSTAVDDMRHAAWNGRGRFLSAGNPAALINQLSDALADIENRTGSAASVTFNTGSLEDNSVLYISLFNSTNWHGQLLAYALDDTNGNVATTHTWDAAAVLDARDITATDSLTSLDGERLILTNGASDGVSFKWANLTTAQKNDLKTNSSGGTDNDATGMARLGHIRGDQSCEQNSTVSCSYTDGTNTYTTKGLRKRTSRLGDIVHSAPVHVGAPEMAWPDGLDTDHPYGLDGYPTGDNTYSYFKTLNSTDAPTGKGKKDRPSVIYVGANDGMLHGFLTEDYDGTGSDNTGKEVLSYIPGNLFSTGASEGLHYLTEASYRHRFYVDLTPSISDAYIKTNTTDTTPSWRTLLVGGQRSGGKGLFALDVTDPSQFSEANAASLVLWEFTHADLGYTFSQPVITPMNKKDGDGLYRWAAIFGNGYNDSGTNGTAQLFIVYLDGGIDGTWTLGTDYFVIDTKAGNTTTRNGMASPAVVDLDGNGTADRVYAGDLQGHMWAFDVSSANTNNWDSAYKQGSTPKPLFTATDSSGTAQPITDRPEVVWHPTASGTPNTLVLFGTGQYLATADKSSTTIQSFYGVWDKGTRELTVDRSNAAASNLTAQTFLGGFATGTRVLSDDPILWDDTDISTTADNKFGWYIDLPDSGERVVTNPVVRGDIVYFTTLIPSSDPCEYGGSGWLMAVKYENGGRPPAPVVDFNNNGTVSDDVFNQASGFDDLTGVASSGKKSAVGIPSSPAFLGNRMYIAGTGSGGGGGGTPCVGSDCYIDDDEVKGLVTSNTGRLSWEELIQ